MTRGTLAYLDFDFERNAFDIRVSDEFNGDMGPTMYEGRKVVKKLRLAETQDHFEKVVWDTVEAFGYSDEYDGEDPANAIRSWPLVENVGTSQDNPFDFNKEALSKIFHYSDYEYIVPYRHSFFVKDSKGKSIEVKPRQLAVFSFGQFEKIYDPKETKQPKENKNGN